MKRIILFLLCFFLLSSCKLLFDNSSMEPIFYRFLFNNDSDVDVLVIMDFNPSPTTISSDNFQMNIWQHHQRYLPSDYYLSLKKSSEDSVFIYVAFMDSLMMYYDGKHKYNLPPEEIKKEALIARISYINKDLFDKDNKEMAVTNIHFPPVEDTSVPIFYYNGYSSEDFK